MLSWYAFVSVEDKLNPKVLHVHTTRPALGVKDTSIVCVASGARTLNAFITWNGPVVSNALDDNWKCNIICQIKNMKQSKWEKNRQNLN